MRFTILREHFQLSISLKTETVNKQNFLINTTITNTDKSPDYNFFTMRAVNSDETTITWHGS